MLTGIIIVDVITIRRTKLRHGLLFAGMPQFVSKSADSTHIHTRTHTRTCIQGECTVLGSIHTQRRRIRTQTSKDSFTLSDYQITIRNLKVHYFTVALTVCIFAYIYSSVACTWGSMVVNGGFISEEAR